MSFISQESAGIQESKHFNLKPWIWQFEMIINKQIINK